MLLFHHITFVISAYVTTFKKIEVRSEVLCNLQCFFQIYFHNLWCWVVPEESTYSLRPGIAYKTKGGVAIGFQFFGKSSL